MRTFWRRLFSRHAVERDIDEELASHLAHKRDALVRDGADSADADRQARVALGNSRVWREETRSAWSLVWLEGLIGDVRFGWRTLRKDRVFSLVSIATLALGFGATAAVFSLVNGLLLRSLPVHEADRLVEVHLTNLPPDVVQWVNGRKIAAREMRGAPYGTMLALAKEPAVAGVLGVAGNGQSAIEVNGRGMLALTTQVSGSFFETLRLVPAAGRFFTTADDVRGAPPGGWPVVISDGAWTRLFQRSPAAIGATIQIERQPVIVAGVAPASFHGINRGVDPEIYIPFHAMESFYGAFRWNDARRVPQIILRLTPGIAFESVRNEIAARSPLLLGASAAPETRSREQHLAQKIDVRRMSANSSGVGRTYGQALWLLLAAVGAVLLIAATNLTNLFLARTMQRSPEFAVRLALGAPASRVRRQVLIEVSLIATAGAALGALVAWQLPVFLVRLFSTPANSIYVDTTPDWTIAAFGAALLVACTFVAGWTPAMAGARANPNAALQSSRATRRVRGRAALIALQTALTLVLLAGTSLLASSLRELWRESTGMDSAPSTFHFADLYNAGVSRERMALAYGNILRQARELPGVSTAAWTMTIPMTGSMSAFQVTVTGKPSTLEMSNLTFWHQVSDGYFAAIGLPLVSGVDFPPAATGRKNICILSENAAVRLFGSARDAVGRFVNPGNLPPTEVIGVSRDAKYIHVREPAPPTIFTPYWNENVSPGMWLVVRDAAGASSASTNAAIQQLFRKEAGRMPHMRIETTETLRAALTAQERALTWLLGGLAGFALLISATGISGLLAYSIERQRKEIGVRLALGATPSSIRRRLTARAMTWVASGIALGTAAAWPLRNVLDSFLFRTSKSDAGVWLAALGALLAATAIAAFIPALRASRTNVLDALRVD